jgi:RNA polymerase sigma-70 factor (ECF subfamily)
MGQEDLGLPAGALVRPQRLAAVTATLVSPGLRVPTRYRIAPVVAWAPAVRHHHLARHLNGTWLTAAAALREADLSPTARQVLTAHPNLEPQPPVATQGSDAARRWTALLLQAQAGDLGQLATLRGEMTPFLRRLLRRREDTRALAERPDDLDEAVSEAFLRVLRGLERFDPARGTALAWVAKIALNEGVNLLRRRGRQVALDLNGLEEVVADRAAADPARRAEGREDLAERLRRLAGVLGAQADLVWQAWQLRQAGVPYRAIAAQLQVPQGTVGTWIHRIRKLSQDDQALGQ